jgi:hypothetical protein
MSHRFALQRCRADSITDLFEVQHKQGEGGSGTVHHCRYRATGQAYSVKTVAYDSAEGLVTCLRAF